jgi:hypothetical protein
MIAQKANKDSAPHEHFLTLCTLGSGFSSVLIAGLTIVALPWVLPAFFGPSYRLGVLPGSVALAVAIVHMSGAPAAARLTVVSLRMTGFINGLWAVLMAVLATIFVARGGAAEATAIYLGAHLVSATLVLISLKAGERVPAGLTQVSILIFGTAVALGLGAAFRAAHPAMALPCSAAMLAAVLLSLAGQFGIARRHGWIPAHSGWNTLPALFPSRFRRMQRFEETGL